MVSKIDNDSRSVGETEEEEMRTYNCKRGGTHEMEIREVRARSKNSGEERCMVAMGIKHVCPDIQRREGRQLAQKWTHSIKPRFIDGLAGQIQRFHLFGMRQLRQLLIHPYKRVQDRKRSWGNRHGYHIRGHPALKVPQESDILQLVVRFQKLA